MPSRLKRKQQRAARMGIYIQFRGHEFWREFYAIDLDKYDVMPVVEWWPRGLSLTRREAIDLAYRISIAKRHKLTITYEDA